MQTHRIACWPGDGIGIDVTAEVIKLLAALEAAGCCRFDVVEFDWGHRHWQRVGEIAPADYLAQLQDFEAVYLGAVGDPQRVPDHISLRPLIEMRQRFDQYVCLRPARLLPGVRSPLADPGDIDMLILRENSEGEYVALGGHFSPGRPEQVAIQTALHTRRGVERILRYGFGLARQRRGHLTMATKSNAMQYSMVLWDEVLAELQPEFADVTCDKCHVDALAMNFVRYPQRYDVVVASNLFGDILSDIGAAIVGSLGIAASCNLNPERRHPSLFEPVHGSAPDIAGQGIANPIAALLSAAMMLDFLGESEAAQRVDAAVLANLAAGAIRTPDLGGTATTVEVGADIIRRVSTPGL